MSKVIYTDRQGAINSKKFILERILGRPLNQVEVVKIEINTIKEGVWKITKKGVQFESENLEGYRLQTIPRK